MRTATVTLAGKQYTLQALPMRQNAEWRRRLAGPFGELTNILENAGSIQLTDGQGLAGVVRTLSGTLLGSVDILLGLLFDYSPALRGDRERIETEAYDDEALRALVEVLKLAYPFGELLTLVRGVMSKETE